MDSLFFSKELVKDSVVLAMVLIEAENLPVWLMVFIKLLCMLDAAALAAAPERAIDS
jgi:hypothetical protein